MGFDEDDLIKLMKLTALITQGIAEVQNIVQNKKRQEGSDEMQIAEHAEIANKEARELIDNL